MPFYFARAGYLLKESKNFILKKYGEALHEVIVLVPNVYAANQLAKLFVSKDLSAALLPKIIPIEEIKIVGNKIVTLDKGELANYFEHQLIIAKIISSSKHYNFNIRQSLDLSKSILILLHEFMKSGREPIDLSKLNYEHFLQLQTLGEFLQEIKDKWLLELSRHFIGDVLDVCLKNCNQLSDLVQQGRFLPKLVLIDVTQVSFWRLIRNLHSSAFDMIFATFEKDGVAKQKWIKSGLIKLLEHCGSKVEEMTHLWPNINSIQEEKATDVSYQVFPNEIKELNFIANLLLSKTHLEPSLDISVILDDLEMVHTLVQILYGYNIEVKNLVGLSLTRNVAVQFLLLIAKLQKQDASVKDLISLLKHPYFERNISENFEHLAISQGLIFQSLVGAKLRLKEQDCRVYQIYSNALFLDKADSSFRGCLKAHFEAAQLLFPLIWQSTEYVAVCEYIQNLFSAARHLEFISKESYWDILTKLLHGKYYADSPLNSKICIVSPRDVSFLNAQLVIVPNFHDESWPSLGDSDVWLSDNIRSELGLSDVRSDQLENYRDYFFSVISFPKALFTRSSKSLGKDTIESRFWSQHFINNF